MNLRAKPDSASDNKRFQVLGKVVGFQRVNLSKEHDLQPLPIVPRPIPPQEHVASVPPVLPARPLESKDLVLDWLLAPKRKVSFVDRVLARLVQAEAHEPDVWERENYRQSAMVVSLARRGNTEPFTVSSYQMYGVHPDKLHAKIVARRKADLGKEYSRWYDENDNLKKEAACPNQTTSTVAPVAESPSNAPILIATNSKALIVTTATPTSNPSKISANSPSRPEPLPSPKKPVQSVKPKKEDRNAA